MLGTPLCTYQASLFRLSHQTKAFCCRTLTTEPLFAWKVLVLAAVVSVRLSFRSLTSASRSAPEVPTSILTMCPIATSVAFAVGHVATD